MNFRLRFNGPIQEGPANALCARIATILEQPTFESLTVMFSSGGGSTTQGHTLYNFIRALPRPIHMHAVGEVSSSAMVVFLAGHKRTCDPTARFLIHPYTWGFEGGQVHSQVLDAAKRLEKEIEISREIAARHTKLSPEKLDKLYLHSLTPEVFSPQEALSGGIVEQIIELNPTGEPQPNVAIWTVGW